MGSQGGGAAPAAVASLRFDSTVSADAADGVSASSIGEVSQLG